MAQYKIPDPEEMVPCPYDKVHMIRAKRMQYHLMKCRKVSIIQLIFKFLLIQLPIVFVLLIWKIWFWEISIALRILFEIKVVFK